MLDAEEKDVVADGVGVRGKHLVRHGGDSLHVGTACCGTHTAPEPHEDQFRAAEVRVRALNCALERRREDPLREERAGAHRSVVGDQALVPYRGERRGTYDYQGGWRYVEGSVRRGPVAHQHGVTDVLVNHGQGGRADDDLVVVVQGVPGQDRRRHRLGK